MPALSIDIEAKYAKFQDALSSMEKSSKQSAANISTAFKAVGGTLAGLGVGLSAAGLVQIVKSSIDAADHLNDLSKKTGVAVETLGGIGFAAKQAGTDLDGVSKGIGKLNLAISDAATGGKETGAAFSALGIGLKDANGNLKDAGTILAEVSGKFENYADGPEKATIGNKLFGKSYADLIPLLDDGAQSLRDNITYYQKYAGISADTAQKADAFNDQLEKIKILSGSAGNRIAAELLPTLSQIAAKLIDVKEKGDGFAGAAKTIGTAFKGVVLVGAGAIELFSALGDHLGAMAATMGRLAHLDFSGAGNVLGEELDQQKKRLKEFVEFSDKILSGDTANTGPAVPKAPPKPHAPLLPNSTLQDAEKKRIEAQLKDFERQSEREREILSSRREMLQTYYQHDLLSINDYYAARKAAADEALAAQSTNIDKEIELLKKRKPKDQVEAEENKGKIKELQDKKAKLEDDASLDAQKRFVEQSFAAKAFQKELDGINTRLLEEKGLLAQAAGQNFDQQTEQIRTKIQSELDSATKAGDANRAKQLESAQKQLDLLRQMAVAQGRLNELQQVESRIQSDLQIASDKADAAATTGAISELEALRKLSNARQQAATDLQAVADAFTATAEASGKPELIQQAKAMQAQVEKLAASADLVREKFKGVFENGFNSFFDKLISGTASIKDAFKSLFNDIASDIARMGFRQLSSDLFKKGGSLGGIVDAAANAFGGKPATTQVSSGIASAIGGGSDATAGTALASLATSTGGVDTAMLALGVSAPAFDSQLASLATTGLVTESMFDKVAASALAASAALDAVAGSGAGSSGSGFIGLFSDFSSTAANGNAYVSGNVIPFAKGGIPGIVNQPTMFPMSGGRTGLMGEAGPEAIMPLHRDHAGQLAVKLVSERGAQLLPITRDQAGKLSVRAPVGGLQKFARGSAFNDGFSTNTNGLFAAQDLRAMTMNGLDANTMVAQGDQTVNNYNVKVDVPAGTSREAADQIAQRTAVALARSSRRNG